MAEYSEFQLNGRKCRLNIEDIYDLQMWYVKSGNRMLKNPYWRRVAINKNKRQYLVCSIGPKKYTHHRVVYYAHNPEWNIYDSSNNNHIDHIDGDRTNNHISNLRVLTQAENNQNTNAKGVSYIKSHKKWKATITVNHKQIHLGFFDTEEEALQARAEGVKKYHPYSARQS